MGPAAAGDGIHVRLDVDVRLVPLCIYKTVDAFDDQMGEYVRDALQEGLCGDPALQRSRVGLRVERPRRSAVRHGDVTIG